MTTPKYAWILGLLQTYKSKTISLRSLCWIRKRNLNREVGITNQDIISVVNNKKLRKYDLLANEPGLIHKTKTKIVPYVITWDGIVTFYHKKHIQELNIKPVVLKKTLESISLERRYSTDQEEVGDEEMERSLEKLVSSSRALEDREEGGVREESFWGKRSPEEPITSSDDGLEDLICALGGVIDTEERKQQTVAQ